MEKAKVLIIEDEESILMGLTDDLSVEGYDVDGEKDGWKGFSLAKKDQYDIIILDIMLPGLNGLEICQRLRQSNISTPIIMLTAKKDEIDRVLGLELGADDYITKPFSRRELLSRIKAVLRRMHRLRQEDKTICFGNVEIDFRKCEARKCGKSFYLTALEYSLLYFLINHKNEVLHRDTILDVVWGKEIYVTPRTVDTHIAHIRKKIEDNPMHPRFIIGVRGIGYKFTY